MALASQSIPTNDRRRVTFSKRRVLTPPLIATILTVGGIGLASWWLLSSGGGDAEGTDGMVAADDSTEDGRAEAQLGSTTAESARGAGRVPPTAPGTPAAAAAPQNNQAQPGNAPTERPSLRALVAEDRAAGEVGSAPSGAAIEMGAARPNQPAIEPPPTGAPNAPAAPAGTRPTETPGNATSPQAPPAAPPAGQPASPPARPPAGPPAAPNLDRPAVGHADLARAMQLQSSDPVAARALVTRLLDEDRGGLSRTDRDRAYELVNALGKSLLLNTNINPNDPFIRIHAVQPGESLAKIVRSQGVACETLLLKRMNGIRDERRIQIGQKLRVPKGAFHAEVIKSEYRFNLYLDAGGGSSERVMVASLRCGLGESGGTPTGLFRVRPKSKLIDPEWTHPKTGEYYASHDPKNPIGEHWIGIVGVEEGNKDLLGYGIHGTVEPDSIGQDRSLGCVRMLADDVAFVYECLVEPHSTIRIR